MDGELETSTYWVWKAETTKGHNMQSTIGIYANETDVYVNKQRLYGQNKMYRQWVALQAKVKPVYWIAVDLFTSASIYLYRDMCSIFIHVNNRLVLQAVFAKNFVHTVWKPTHTPLRKYHKIINWMKTKGKICVSTQI